MNQPTPQDVCDYCGEEMAASLIARIDNDNFCPACLKAEQKRQADEYEPCPECNDVGLVFPSTVCVCCNGG